MTRRTRIFFAGSAAILVAGLCTGLVAYYTGGFQTVSASPISGEMRYVPADASLVAYADGERFGTLPIDIEVVPNALRLLETRG